VGGSGRKETPSTEEGGKGVRGHHLTKSTLDRGWKNSGTEAIERSKKQGGLAGRENETKRKKIKQEQQYRKEGENGEMLIPRGEKKPQRATVQDLGERGEQQNAWAGRKERLTVVQDSHSLRRKKAPEKEKNT